MSWKWQAICCVVHAAVFQAHNKEQWRSGGDAVAKIHFIEPGVLGFKERAEGALTMTSSFLGRPIIVKAIHATSGAVSALYLAWRIASIVFDLPEVN